MTVVAKQILVDLSGAYDAKVASLPEIETAVNQLLKAAGHSISVTVLRESQELVYSANVFNLLTAINAGDEEGNFLRAAFLKMAAPDQTAESPDLSKLRSFSNSAQDLFVWIFNYRRQHAFDQQKLNVLLGQVQAIQADA
jgi:hypothetical protein